MVRPSRSSTYMMAPGREALVPVQDRMGLVTVLRSSGGQVGDNPRGSGQGGHQVIGFRHLIHQEDFAASDPGALGRSLLPWRRRGRDIG